MYPTTIETVSLEESLIRNLTAVMNTLDDQEILVTEKMDGPIVIEKGRFLTNREKSVISACETLIETGKTHRDPSHPETFALYLEDILQIIEPEADISNKKKLLALESEIWEVGSLWFNEVFWFVREMTDKSFYIEKRLKDQFQIAKSYSDSNYDGVEINWGIGCRSRLQVDWARWIENDPNGPFLPENLKAEIGIFYSDPYKPFIERINDRDEEAVEIAKAISTYLDRIEKQYIPKLPHLKDDILAVTENMKYIVSPFKDEAEETNEDEDSDSYDEEDEFYLYEWDVDDAQEALYKLKTKLNLGYITLNR